MRCSASPINIAGKNSYAVQDIADTGNYSGLQTDDSDYVGRVALDWGPSTRIAARGRFDHNDFSVQRGEIGAQTVLGAVTASAAYLYIRKDPNIQINSPTATISGNASVNILDNWRLFGVARLRHHESDPGQGQRRRRLQQQLSDLLGRVQRGPR